MLGSLSEAEDAVQDGWLRMSRAETADVQNMAAWMTTVVARVCLDALRSRKARRELALEPEHAEHGRRESSVDPEDEAIMADAVGLALLVVLETLTPGERLCFVLHEMFGMPFDEIAAIAGRSPEATRQLASRARRRLQGSPREVDIGSQRAVVDRYLAALRAGDLAALLTVLDPNVLIRADRSAVPAHLATEVRGANASAQQAMQLARGAKAARPALIDGHVGIIVAPRGQLKVVLQLTISAGKITAIDVVAERARLNALELALLDDAGAVR